MGNMAITELIHYSSTNIERLGESKVGKEKGLEVLTSVYSMHGP
jgi:hypothetical protein